jgi:hypothetical protein
MDTQESLTERIEAYLAGSLDPEQKLAFEQQLASDPDLQNTVYRHRKASVAINYALRESLKERLQAIDREAIPAAGPSHLRIRLIRFAAAASILVLLAVGLHFYAYRNYTTSAIAERMFAETRPEQFRGGGDTAVASDDAFTQAGQLFHAHKYELAAQEYLAIIDSNSLLKGKAEWNLVLCYYAEDPTSPRFKALFDKILADPNHDYHAHAVKLRNMMHGTLYRIVNR